MESRNELARRFFLYDSFWSVYYCFDHLDFLTLIAKTAIFGLPNVPKVNVLGLAKKVRFSSAPAMDVPS
jgi:hypothetical protein